MRICSLLPSSTEIVYALGLGDHLVGVTHECDYPPEAATKPHVTESILDPDRLSSLEIDHRVSASVGQHGSIYHLKEDLLRELKPDLILTQELCQVCAVSYSEVREAAKVLHGETKIVSLEPNTLSEVLDTILVVGELTGREAEAQTRVSELRDRIERVRQRVAGTTAPRVHAMEWLDPPYSPGHWVPEMVQIAGGREVLGQSGQKSRRLTGTEIVDAAPEVIILMPCGFSLERTLKEFDRTPMFEGWSQLPAVLNRQVYAVDGSSYFNRCGPRLVDGIEILSEILHPERRRGAAPKQSYKAVYEQN
jgi:iron complex transport system substrate-binding protein